MEAKRSHDWDQSAALWAAIVEPNRDRKKRQTAYTALDIHPFAKRIQKEIAKHKRSEQKEPPVPISSLREMFKGWAKGA